MKLSNTIQGVIVSVYLETRNPTKEGTFPVKIRVYFKGERKYYGLGFYLSEREFEAIPTARTKEKIQIWELIKANFRLFETHVKEIAESGGFSFELLDNRLGRGDKNSVFAAFEIKIAELRRSGRIGSAVAYTTAMKSLKDYFKSENLSFGDISPAFLRAWENDIQKPKRIKTPSGKTKMKPGNNLTTVGINMRCLRAVINEAKAQGIISEARYPFGRGKYEIPSGSGRKMALTLEQVAKLANYPTESQLSEKLRDLWLFSYMANGINIKDLVCLKWKNISDGEIVFYRAKTARTKRDKKPIQAPILPEMEVILSRWGNPDKRPESYVFGYLMEGSTPEETYFQAKNLTRLMNRHLQKIAIKAGLPKISTYTARHSYATVLKRSGASIEYISESLGHSDLKTTENYLDSFEKETRVKINQNLVNFKKDENS